MSKDDKSLDTLDGSEPRSDPLDGVVIDGAVFVEWSDLGVASATYRKRKMMEDDKTHGSRSDTRHVEADTTSRVGEG